MEIERLTLPEWANALPATGFEWAHTPGTLQAINDHVTGELRLYGGFNGQQLVGLLPVVVRTELFATAVISPPPGFGITRMGPVLLPTSPKRRKQEKVNREFTAGVLEAVGAHNPFTLFGLSCSTEYTDPRPYIWAGFDVETRFTYRLDLHDTTPEHVQQSYSKSLRREIRDAENAGVTVSRRGIEGARDVYAAHEARRSEQGDSYPVSWEYTRDFVARLGERTRTYVAETPDGEFASGVTVVYSNDEGYFFQGGTRTDHLYVNVNGLLHSHVIEDILTDPALDSVTRYELGNANIEPLARYKSKYGGELVPYCFIKSGRLMDLAQKAYELLIY
ncbi:MAG TPA: GNAT family N-acetyltransferase [Halococcus sp.]|nr:GNAT family N-acetyltransferase [Halococcus sp.]